MFYFDTSLIIKRKLERERERERERLFSNFGIMLKQPTMSNNDTTIDCKVF